MQKIEKLLENENFLNNQNYVNSKLQRNISPLNIILSKQIVNLVNNSFCTYSDTNNKENILIIVFFVIIFGALSYISIMFLMNIIFVLIFIYILVYIFLGLSGFNIKKIKIFINFTDGKKNTICKVKKSGSLIEDMFFNKK